MLFRSLKLIESEPDMGIYFTNYDILCVSRVAAFHDVGIWDESFKYYSSDVDYYYRFGKSKWKISLPQTAFSSRVLHMKGSATLIDPRWKDIIVDQNPKHVERLPLKISNCILLFYR